MRKSLFWLFSTFLFFTLPVYAQHSTGGSHGGGGTHGGSQHGGNVHAGGAVHQGVQQRSAHSRISRGHFHNGRFDHGYFAGHWGAGNPFFWGECRWWGPRFGIGSWFWYNDAYFVILEPIPSDWYDDEVYVDEYDGGYVLVNPMYTGVHFGVRVRL